MVSRYGIITWLQECDLAGGNGSGVLPVPTVPASAKRHSPHTEPDQDSLRDHKRQRRSSKMPLGSSHHSEEDEAQYVNFDTQVEAQEQMEEMRITDSQTTPKPKRTARRQTPQQTRKRDLASILTPTQTLTATSDTQDHHPSPTRSNSYSESSGTSRLSKRSRSPVKSMDDLRLASKPVRWVQMNKLDKPPDYIKGLLAQLVRIRAGTKIVPIMLKDRIIDNFLPLEDCVFNDKNIDSNLVLQEFEKIESICNEALECESFGVSEATWNAEVHSRVLRLALSNTPNVKHNLVTSATICPDFTPKDIKGEYMGSRLVDYTINIIPDEKSADAMTRLMVEQSYSTQTINQTRYSAVRFRPCAISMETKISQSAEAVGKVQLAVWSSAHFARLRSLRHEIELTDIPPHPIILVHAHQWKLAFACDLGEKILIINSVNIGETESVLGLYKLVASLKCLAQWSIDVYWKWYTTHILEIDGS